MILDDIQTPFEHFKLTSKLMIRNVCWYMYGLKRRDIRDNT